MFISTFAILAAVASMTINQIAERREDTGHKLLGHATRRNLDLLKFIILIINTKQFQIPLPPPRCPVFKLQYFWSSILCADFFVFGRHVNLLRRRQGQAKPNNRWPTTYYQKTKHGRQTCSTMILSKSRRYKANDGARACAGWLACRSSFEG